MRTTPSYKDAFRLRAAALALMLALGAAVGCKLYYSGMKIRDYAEAEKRYAAGDAVAAEFYFGRAAANGWLRYEEAVIASRLDELSRVTALRTELLAIGDRAGIVPPSENPLRSLFQFFHGDPETYPLPPYEKAGQTRIATAEVRFQTVLDAYEDFAERKRRADAGKGSDRFVFAQLSDRLGIGSGLTEALRRFEEEATRSLEAGMRLGAFADEAVLVMLQLPVGYYGGEQSRDEALRARLEPYDQARVEALRADAGLTEWLAEGVRLSELYGQYDFKPSWLFAQLERKVQERLAARLAQNDWAAFLLEAKRYEEAKGWPSAGSPVTRYIRDRYADQLAAADRLVDRRQYAEAIALYETLAAYRDTRAKIRDAELAWTAAQPDQLLRRALPLPGVSFAPVVAGAGQFGAIAYAAGVSGIASGSGVSDGSVFDRRDRTGPGGKLVLARLMADRTIDRKEVDLGADVEVKELRAVDGLGVQGMPALLVQAASSTHLSRFIAYEMLQSGLHKLFDIEADGYRIERRGLLVAEHGNGTGASRHSYYEYRNGQYELRGTACGPTAASC